MLLLLEGPAGSGKSQDAEELIRSGQFHVLADLTALWAALRAMRRGPDGRYPIREDTDPGLELAQYIRAVAVRQGLSSGLNVVVTSATPDTAVKWAAIAEELGTQFQVRTIDPGQAAVREALAEEVPDGYTLEDDDEEMPRRGGARRVLRAQCGRAVRRWYGGRGRRR